MLAQACGEAFIGDIAYDSDRLRAAIAARGIKAVIPPNPTRKQELDYDKLLYSIRYRIECFFHQLKRCRRIATRYEKTARNYLSFVHLACALMWLG